MAAKPLSSQPEPAKKTGRPTECTPELTQKFAVALGKGMPRDLACDLLRIHRATFYDWMAKGADGVHPYADFADAIKEAEGQLVSDCLDAIVEAGSGDNAQWQARAWLLERRHTAMFGRSRVEVSGPDGGPVQTQARVVIVPPDAPDSATWAATAQTRPRDDD